MTTRKNTTPGFNKANFNKSTCTKEDIHLKKLSEGNEPISKITSISKEVKYKKQEHIFSPASSSNTPRNSFSPPTASRTPTTTLESAEYPFPRFLPCAEATSSWGTYEATCAENKLQNRESSYNIKRDFDGCVHLYPKYWGRPTSIKNSQTCDKENELHQLLSSQENVSVTSNLRATTKEQYIVECIKSLHYKKLCYMPKEELIDICNNILPKFNKQIPPFSLPRNDIYCYMQNFRNELIIMLERNKHKPENIKPEIINKSENMKNPQHFGQFWAEAENPYETGCKQDTVQSEKCSKNSQTDACTADTETQTDLPTEVLNMLVLLEQLSLSKNVANLFSQILNRPLQEAATLNHLNPRSSLHKLTDSCTQTSSTTKLHKENYVKELFVADYLSESAESAVKMNPSSLHPACKCRKSRACRKRLPSTKIKKKKLSRKTENIRGLERSSEPVILNPDDIIHSQCNYETQKVMASIDMEKTVKKEEVSDNKGAMGDKTEDGLLYAQQILQNCDPDYQKYLIQELMNRYSLGDINNWNREHFISKLYEIFQTN